MIDLSKIYNTLNEKANKEIDRRILNIHEEEENGDIQGTLDDPTLDPSLEKEYYHSSFEEGDTLVTIKTIGVGKNKPVSVYLNDVRWEMFPGPKKAESTAREFVNSKQYEGWKERKGLVAKEEAPEEAPSADETENDKEEEVKESLENIINRETKYFETGGDTIKVDPSIARAVLGIYETLNKDNRSHMEEMLRKDKYTFYEIAEFALNNR